MRLAEHKSDLAREGRRVGDRGQGAQATFVFEEVAHARATGED